MDKTYAMQRYALHLEELGYPPSEVTLMLIGYVKGWTDLEEALDRLSKAIEEK
jgi:hypothetical protein